MSKNVWDASRYFFAGALQQEQCRTPCFCRCVPIGVPELGGPVVLLKEASSRECLGMLPYLRGFLAEVHMLLVYWAVTDILYVCTFGLAYLENVQLLCPVMKSFAGSSRYLVHSVRALMRLSMSVKRELRRVFESLRFGRPDQYPFLN